LETIFDTPGTTLNAGTILNDEAAGSKRHLASALNAHMAQNTESLVVYRADA